MIGRRVSCVIILPWRASPLRAEDSCSADSSHDRLFHLTPWDAPLISVHNIQKGLLFTDLPPALPADLILSRLKTSLSIALRHFYPLAGRFLTQEHRNEDGEVASLSVCIDCNDEGVDFIHAVAENIFASDVLSPGEDNPSFVKSFFPCNGAINYEGHSSPLLTVQVTELAGRSLFLACCFNHAVGDGTSFWNFFNAWAEIARSSTLSRLPALKRWFVEGQSPPIRFPFSDPDQLATRPSLLLALGERFFHFSSESVAKLKARANEEVGTKEGIVISSFQALSALMWRAITRARGLQAEQVTSFYMAIQHRERLRPALSPEYFGNSMAKAQAAVAAGDLLENGIGWAAHKLNQAVAGHTDAAIREQLRAYHEKPIVYRIAFFGPATLMMASSPRFDVYGCDFGWGKPAAVRSGTASKFDGDMSSFPGKEGGGSVDLEVCLLPQFMEALLVDKELLEATL